MDDNQKSGNQAQAFGKPVSEDVTLRRATAADAEFLMAIRSEPGANRYQPLRNYSLERLRNMLAQRADQILDSHLDGKVQWVILYSGTPVGWINLDVTSREHGVGSIGYTIGREYHGRGIATEAVHQVVAIAFDPDGIALDRLEAVAAVANAASRRVLTKVGFHEEGVAEKLLVIDGVRVDHMRFGLVRATTDATHQG